MSNLLGSPSSQLKEEVMRKMLRIIVVCALAILVAPPSIADDTSTDFPVQLIYDKVSEGDIEGATDLLTNDAVFLVVTAPGLWSTPALVGPEAIGKWWTGIHKDNGRFEVSDLVVGGDRSIFTGLYHGDRLDNWGVSPAEFDGLAVLRDGKVRLLALSYSADYEPKLDAARKKYR